MNIDLSNLLNSSDSVHHLNGEVNNQLIDLDLGDYKIVEPIKYNGYIYKSSSSYDINIDIAYKYETKCARCLHSTIKEVKTSLAGELLNYGEKPEASVKDDDVIFLEKDGILDIDKHIIGEVVSSLPMKTLCAENCKGICPQCGTDLNTESCDCLDEYIDPRFEKLKDFFVKD